MDQLVIWLVVELTRLKNICSSKWESSFNGREKYFETTTYCSYSVACGPTKYLFTSIGSNPLILTIDPNFQRDIQVYGGVYQRLTKLK